MWDGATFGDALTISLFIAASKGSVGAAREIREGIEGKANGRLRTEIAEPTLTVVFEKPPGATPDQEGKATPKKAEE